jgi:hypothetical protein
VTTRFVATTLVDVYRDNSGLPATGAFDGYDDELPSTTPLHRDRPAHLYQQQVKTYDPVAGRNTSVEAWVGRMRPGSDVRISDRIYDQRANRWFVVDAVNTPVLVIGAADVKLSLTRIAR